MPDKYFCHNCGNEVGKDAYEVLGNGSRIWFCDAPECVRSVRDTHREVEDNARYEAERDGYERYM